MHNVCINEDNSHFFGSRKKTEMNKIGLKELVDNYSAPNVGEIFFSVNAMRASYQSKIFDSVWQGVTVTDESKAYWKGEELKPFCSNWIINTKKLHQEGINPYCFWIDYAKEKGISPWISIRMNDCHCTDEKDNFMHSSFWRDNPDKRRQDYRLKNLASQALDYNHQFVREYYLKLIEECLELYDMDGIELDWLRFGFHFSPGLEDHKTLTKFMEKIKSLTVKYSQKRKHDIKINVRIPSRPESAWRLGFDIAEWSRKKLIDMLTVSNFWECTDGDIPLENWRAIIGNDIILAAGVNDIIHCRTNHKAEVIFNTPEMIFGFAMSFLYRGANYIYLFNHMDRHKPFTNKEEIMHILDNISSVDKLKQVSRRHVLTYQDIYYPGEPEKKTLPQQVNGREWFEARLNVGFLPVKNYKCYIILGIDSLDDNFELRLNGNKCAMTSISEIELPSSLKKVIAWEASNCNLKDGDMLIELKEKANSSFTVTWCEIYFKIDDLTYF